MNTNNYYRITGYCEQEDFCFVIDCYGAYEKLWQFSSFLVQKGLKVLEVGNDGKFLDAPGENGILPIPFNGQKILLRANALGRPEYVNVTVDGTAYRAVKVADKIYVPDRAQVV